MILFPNCKINLGLDVIRRRGDGFHDVETVMMPVRGLCDVLEIVPAEHMGAQFYTSGLTLDCAPQDNICLRAYGIVAAAYPDSVGGVRMHLHKITPSGAGLGGGSSDAAAVVRGMKQLFGLDMSDERMRSLCAKLGSDVPFFVSNEPQLAQGRGEVLSPISLPLSGKLLALVKPPIAISTAEAYGGITPLVPETSLVHRLATVPIEMWGTSIHNAFEPHLFAAHPLLAQIKEQLYGMGAVYTSMSGSGSTMYGIFDDDCSELATRISQEFTDYFTHIEVL